MIARLDLGLIVVTLVATPLAGWRWRNALPPDAVHATPMPGVVSQAEPYDEDSLDVAFEALVHRNPFRLSRMPSDIPYSPFALAEVPSAPRFVPPLVLRGIVGGPPWQAVIDGIPGLPVGTVVRSGNVFDRLTIRSVTRDSVFVQTPDTAWFLTLVKGSE